MEHTCTHRTPETKITGSRLTCGRTLWTGKKGGEGSQRSSVSSALIPSVLIFSRLWMASQPGCWEWPYGGRSYITRRRPFPSFPARLLSTLATPTLVSLSKVLPFQKCWLGAIGQNVVFFPQCDPPRSHLVVARVIVGLFFFLAVCYSAAWTACSLIVHPLERIWVISTFGVFLNKVAVYTYEHFNVNTVPGSCDGHKFIHIFF